jgi:thiol-disulfide isomerase/thioredoxin
MKSFFYIALLSLLITVSASAQTAATTKPITASADNGFRISARIRGLKDTTVVLAHWYYVPGQYIPKDTARVDAEGRMTFEGKNKLPEGLYLVVTPNQRYTEFVITNEQNFAFETDTASLVQSMKITGSKENEAFYSYQQQMGKFYDETQALEMQKKMRNDAVSTALFNKQRADVNKRANEYRKQFLTDNDGLFAVKLFKASSEPEVPEPPKAKNGRPDSLWTFNYYKAHYWDDFDLADQRFLRTPILQRKVERYIKELTVQVSDSLIKEADMLIGRTKPDKEMQQYMIYYITSQYEQPKILGTDEVFIHMAEKYYLTGIMPLSDSSARARIVEKVNTLKPVLVGKPFPIPNVSDTLRRPINFATIKTPYTVVFFYAPHCGHCREATPKLKAFADANRAKEKDVTFVAVAVEDSPEDWKKFIQEFKIGDWQNGYDFTFRTDFRHQYDVFTTPMVYILDKDKKIIARKLPAEQIEDFLGFYKRQQAAKTDKVQSVKAAK